MIQQGVKATDLDAKIQYLVESYFDWNRAMDLVDVTGIRTLSTFALLNTANKDLSDSERAKKDAILDSISARQDEINAEKAFIESGKESQKFWDDYFRRQEAEANFDAAFITGVYEEMADRRKEINKEITDDTAAAAKKQLDILNQQIVDSLRYLYQFDEGITEVGHGVDDFTTDTSMATDAVYAFKGALSATADDLSKFYDELARGGGVGIPDVTTGAGAIPQVGGTGLRVPHFDTGGPVQNDGLIFAHAGEYVLPREQVNSGGWSRVTNNIVINVTQPFGTPQAIAAAVDAAIMNRARSIGGRLPSGA